MYVGMAILSLPSLISLVSKKGDDVLTFKHEYGVTGAKEKILSINIDGPISTRKPKSGAIGLITGTSTVSGYEIQEVLEKAAKDDRIKGIVIQLQTPGGEVAGAQAIYDGIVRYREATGRPAIAHVQGISASGGVFAMVGAEAIYAEPGSLVGSIGVTLGTRHWYKDPVSTTASLLSPGVETRGGIESYVLARGKGKDALSEWREPAPEELQVFDRQLIDIYDQFVTHVSDARKIPQEIIRDKMGAYVFANKEAAELGLIDGTMTRTKVFASISQKAGIVGDYEVVTAKPIRPEGGILNRLLSPRSEQGQTPEAYRLVGVLAVAPAFLWQNAR